MNSSVSASGVWRNFLALWSRPSPIWNQQAESLRWSRSNPRTSNIQLPAKMATPFRRTDQGQRRRTGQGGTSGPERARSFDPGPWRGPYSCVPPLLASAWVESEPPLRFLLPLLPEAAETWECREIWSVGRKEPPNFKNRIVILKILLVLKLLLFVFLFKLNFT